MCSSPVQRCHAPTVARHESGEAVPRLGCREVVADAALMFEELARDDSADGVAPQILRAGVAATVAKEPGDRVGATRLQFLTQDIALCHYPSIAHRVSTRASGPRWLRSERSERWFLRSERSERLEGLETPGLDLDTPAPRRSTSRTTVVEERAPASASQPLDSMWTHRY